MSDNNSNAGTNDTKSVEITRVFDAPVGLIWDMWTSGEHFASWYGPMGADVSISEFDLRVGGRRLVNMKMETPNGPMEMWFVGEFKEIAENDRLVYTESMADADGNAKSAADMGMPDGHPMETRVVVVLTESDGQTTMSMTHEGVPEGSPGAMGWNMALDKLEAKVAAAG